MAQRLRSAGSIGDASDAGSGDRWAHQWDPLGALPDLLAGVDPAVSVAKLVDAFVVLAGAGVDVAALDGPHRSGPDVSVLGGSEQALLRAESQVATEQGPLLDARSSPSLLTYWAPDIPHRWPAYASRLPAAGIRGVAMATEVDGAVTSIDIAALDEPSAPPLESMASLAHAFIAAIELRHRLFERDARIANLERALERRTRTEQAKGFIHARSPLAPEEAFEALRSHARRTSTPLADVVAAVLDGRCPVEDIVETG